MSGVPAISGFAPGHMAAGAALGTGACGANLPTAASPSAAGSQPASAAQTAWRPQQLLDLGGVSTQQLVSQGLLSHDSSRLDTLAALLIALLLSKAENSREKNNTAALLAELAVLAAFTPETHNAAGVFSQQFHGVPAAAQAYAGGAVQGSTGGQLNAVA